MPIFFAHLNRFGICRRHGKTNARAAGAMSALLNLAFAGLAYGQVDLTKGGTVTAATLEERYAIVSATPTNIALVPDPAGSGRVVFRSTVRHTDTRVYGGQRAELSVRREYVKSGPRWYAMSVYIPSTWVLAPYRIIVAQIQTSQKTAILQPPLAFLVEQNELLLELHSNTRDVDSPDGATKANSSGRIVRLGPLATNRWICWVVQADWSNLPGTGSLNVWMNGKLVFTSQNETNSYETWLGNNPRIGIYSPGTLGATQRQIYADFVWVGGELSALGELSAYTPCGRASD